MNPKKWIVCFVCDTTGCEVTVYGVEAATADQAEQNARAFLSTDVSWRCIGIDAS